MRECPAPIMELPPELKPKGANVTWIPGYWAWDDERNDFLWVSGIWRDLPHGRQWVPGYWCVCESGYQWTPGYWADAKWPRSNTCPSRRRRSKPDPSTSPFAGNVWMPGIWVWRFDHYVWAGVLGGRQAGWTWIPDHYVWAPRGYVFVNGYWDYSLDRRGTLFAPVCFTRNVFARTAFVYSPTIARSGSTPSRTISSCAPPIATTTLAITMPWPTIERGFIHASPSTNTTDTIRSLLMNVGSIGGIAIGTIGSCRNSTIVAIIRNFVRPTPSRCSSHSLHAAEWGAGTWSWQPRFDRSRRAKAVRCDFCR